MPAVELVAAVGDEDERARVRQAAGDVVEQLARGRVGPVDVLDDEQQAALARRQREQTDDGLEEAKLGLSRVADGRVGLVAAEEREELRELPPCRAELRRRAGRCPGARGSCRPPRRAGGRGARTRPRCMRPRAPPSRAAARGPRARSRGASCPSRPRRRGRRSGSRRGGPSGVRPRGRRAGPRGRSAWGRGRVRTSGDFLMRLVSVRRTRRQSASSP